MCFSVPTVFQAFEAIEAMLFCRNRMGYFGCTRFNAAAMGGHNQYVGMPFMGTNPVVFSFFFAIPQLAVVCVIGHQTVGWGEI